MEVRVEALSKRYGLQWAVRNLEFRLPPASITGFLGPNGAGKSTTMKMMTGYVEPTEGRVWFGDLELEKHRLEVRRQLGYLPEHNPLYLDLYVQEHLRLAGRLHGLRSKSLGQAVERAVEATGLGPELHKKVGALSKGYRQRVGLAQAILHDPQVLILDEPTSGLDPNQVQDIRQLIRHLGSTKTVVFSSHILTEVEAVAQQVMVIHQGQLVAHAPLHELKTRGSSLEDVFRSLTQPANAANL